MNEHSATLLSRGWQRIVRVREEDEYVDIHLRLSEDGRSIYGLAIAALENDARGSEAQFINIAGDYTMQDIASISRQLGIGRLEGLELP